MVAASHRERALPLLVLAGACAVAFCVLYLIFVRTGHGQRIDEAAFQGRGVADEGQPAANRLLNTISIASLVIATVVLVGQALIRHRADLSLVAAGVIAGSVISAELLKDFLSRPILYAGPLPTASFPSGHTAIAFSVGVAAILVVPARLRNWAALAAVLYGSGIGIATVAAGWHRPSDAAASLLLVTAWAAAVVALSDRAAAAARSSADPPTGEWPRPAVSRRYLLAGAALLGAGYLGAIAIAFARQAGAIDWTLGNAAFFASCAAILALAAILVAALLAALRVGSRELGEPAVVPR